MVKLISEKLAIATYTYPFAEEKKDIFYSYIKTLPSCNGPNPVPENNFLITRTDLYIEEILQPLLHWITQILHRDFETQSIYFIIFLNESSRCLVFRKIKSRRVSASQNLETRIGFFFRRIFPNGVCN